MGFYTRKVPLKHKLILIVGDGLLFALFTMAGRMEHRMELTATGLMETALPFFASWLVIGSLMGVFSRHAIGRPTAVVKRVTFAWLISGPIGILLRAWILQIPVSLEFAGVTMGFVWIMLIIWRSLYAFGANRRKGTRYV